MHRHFLEYFLKIQIIYKHIATMEIILLILHVVDGIFIKFRNVDIVESHLFKYKY